MFVCSLEGSGMVSELKLGENISGNLQNLE